MAEQYRYFGSATGDTRQYNQAEFAEVLYSIIDNGYLGQELNELLVTESTPTGMSVTVKSGQAWLNGYWYQNDASKVLTIATANATNPRIDTIILRLDTINARSIVATVLNGTASSSPVAPTLTQTTQMFEFPLCDVYVGAGVTSIVNANLTDRRVQSFLQDTDELMALIALKATTANFNATLPSASWTGSSAPFSKAVTVNGIVATDIPILDIVPSGTYATDQTMVENWSNIYRAVATLNTITFYATEVPSADIPFIAKVVR